MSLAQPAHAHNTFNELGPSMPCRSKRKSQDISDETSDGFFLSAAAAQPSVPSAPSAAQKRFKKTKSFKSFHDLTSENFSEKNGEDDEKIIVTPNSDMYMSGFGAVSDDGSACSSRRNSACASSDNLLAFEKGGYGHELGTSRAGNVSPNVEQPIPISAPPSMPPSPSTSVGSNLNVSNVERAVPKSKSGWGWFVNMDLPGVASRQLSVSNRTVSLNSLNEMPLAFIKENKQEQRVSGGETEEDKSVKWAKAADVVDELFGDLDMPEF